MFFLIMFCIALSLSYFLLWLIYRKALKSKKKISKFLVFLGSIGLIIFYYTPPYSFYLEPSYWKFRNMCKLNELPNNEEKYNKILRYFDADLDSLDWEELNKRVERIEETNGWYRKGKNEYKFDDFEWNKYNNRIELLFIVFSNESIINRHDISFMYLSGIWHTRRYFLEKESMTSYNLVWIERTLGCKYIVKENGE